MNPEITRLIEQYLNKELSEADRLLFEQRLTENDRLLQEVILQRQIHAAAKRAAQRETIKQTAKRYHFRKNVIKGGIATLVIAALTTAALWLIQHTGQAEKQETMETKAFTTLISQLDTLAPLENLPVTYFNLSREDTVLLSPTGVLLSVPESAFLLNGKPYSGQKVIQWQEAVNASDIVKAGLSTTSGNRLLETQGMFGMQAFTPEGRQLDVNPNVGVYVQVPVNELKKDMQLFEGKRMQNGQIDWQNPQPLEKLPVPVEMTALDFYPPGYENKLNALKWKTGKQERDSLYASFEEDRTENQFSYTVRDVAPRLYDIQQSVRNDSVVPDTIEMVSVKAGAGRPDNGKQLFTQLCATCHNAHTDGTGPKLYQVRKKWADGGAKAGSIYEWVADWQKAVKNDRYAENVMKIKPTIHPNYPQLKGKTGAIDAIFDYVDGIPNQEQHIPPSSVLAFWKPKFNNTILATREFEQRMKAVHNTCDKRALEAYVNQLNKPLWQIDEEVAAMGYPAFREFAAERVGGIKLDNPHMNNLRHFYEKSVADLRKELKKNRNYTRNLEKKWDAHLQQLRTDERMRTIDRNERNYREEYDLNLAAAMQQLGISKKTVGFTIRKGGKPPGKLPAVNTYNLDRFIAEVTTNRTTGTFTDPNTGKKATITYNPFTLTVNKHETYGKLLVYLFPHEMNSFQRIDGKNGVFDYPLNDGITYDMVVVGINETGYYLFEKSGFNTGTLGTVKLEQVSEKIFNTRIEALNSGRQKKPMKINRELEWLTREQQDYKVQRLRKEMESFRNELRPLIFPCMTGSEAAPAKVVEISF